MIYYLPCPISTNRYWHNYRCRTVRSSDAVAYKEHVAPEPVKVEQGDLLGAKA